MIKKIKYLLILIFLLSFINVTFANGFSTGSINNCLEIRCINERIDELIEVNKRLQIENKELSDKYNKFNSGLDYYLKILDQGRDITNEKKEAYNIALNNIFNWIKWYGGILSVLITIVGVGFGLYKQNEIKNSKKEILDDIGVYREELKDYKEDLKKSNADNIDIIKERILISLTEKEIKKEVLEKLENNMRKHIEKLFYEELENNKKFIQELIDGELENNKYIQNNKEKDRYIDEIDDADLLDKIDGID